MNAEFLIIASRDGSFRALDARDGAARWTQSCGHPFGGLALVRVKDSVIAAALDGYLCALALDDGTVRWEARLPDVIPIGDPLVGLRVAAHGDQVVVQHSAQCFSIDPLDGHVIWKGGRGSRSIVSLGWWVLAVGQANAYVLIQEDAPPPPPPADPRLSRPPIFNTTALSTWDGTPRWGTRDASAIKPGWDGAPPLAEADGVVYSYGRELHALDAASGKRLWTSEDVPRHTWEHSLSGASRSSWPLGAISAPIAGIRAPRCGRRQGSDETGISRNSSEYAPSASSSMPGVVSTTREDFGWRHVRVRRVPCGGAGPQRAPLCDPTLRGASVGRVTRSTSRRSTDCGACAPRTAPSSGTSRIPQDSTPS